MKKGNKYKHTFHLSWELCQDFFLYSDASHLCVQAETKSASKTLILEFNGSSYRRNARLLHKFHSMGLITVCTCHLSIQTTLEFPPFSLIPSSHILMNSSSTQIRSRARLCSWLSLSMELMGFTKKNYKTMERKPLSEQIANSKDSSGVVFTVPQDRRDLQDLSIIFTCCLHLSLFGTRAGWGSRKTITYYLKVISRYTLLTNMQDQSWPGMVNSTYPAYKCSG